MPDQNFENMQQALDLIAEFGGNLELAARENGIAASTLRNRRNRALSLGLEARKPKSKPRIKIPARSVYRPTPESYDKPTRVFVYGCSHDSPIIADKSRYARAGKLLTQFGADYVVDLGDTMDLDSLSSHAFAGSQEDRERPFFTTEIESLDEAQSAFNDYAPSADDIPRMHCHGNHEYRANRFEANNPTSQGVYTTQIDQIYARYNWNITAFKEWLYIDNVGFTHAPINGMGREVGGKTADQTVAREATHSVVWSHTHKSNKVRMPKFGIGNAIDVFNSGCFMPEGYIKAYAGVSQTGWTYGVHILTLRGGNIESVKTWSELELREIFQ